MRKRLQVPLPASPHRTTSQLSVVSVEAQVHNTDSGRPLLSQTLRSRSSSAPLRAVAAPSTSSSSSRTSIADVSIGPSSPSNPVSRSTTPAFGLGAGSTRKGKEKAVEGVDEVDVSGEMAADTEGDAARGLRRLVRQNEEGGVRGMPPAGLNVSLGGDEAMTNLKPPDGRFLLSRPEESGAGRDCSRRTGHEGLISRKRVPHTAVFRAHTRRQASLHFVSCASPCPLKWAAYVRS